MKKLITTLIIITTVFVSQSFSQALLVENFDYPATELLTAHGWTAHSGGTTNAIPVVSPGLTYTEYPFSGMGNAASLTTSGQDVNKKFTDSVTSGDVYASLMVNVTSAQSAGDYFFHLGPKTMGNIFMGRVFVKLAANGKLAFGVSKSTTNPSSSAPTIFPTYTDSLYETGTTYLLVLKYTFNPDTSDDVARLFVDPVISVTEPAPTIEHNNSPSNDPSDIGTVSLRQGTSSSAPNITVDGIKIATSWSEIVPVELTSFAANVTAAGVNLNWKTATEVNNSGFEVERSVDGKSYSSIGFVTGKGTTTEENNYSFVDINISAGREYYYRLKQIDYDGTFEYSKVVYVSVVSPKLYSLEQNYPNPFNPATSINFNIPVDAKVVVKVYDVLGNEIQQVLDNNLSAGNHLYNVNLSNVSSGIYFYRLEANGVDGSIFSSSRKMILTK